MHFCFRNSLVDIVQQQIEIKSKQFPTSHAITTAWNLLAKFATSICSTYRKGQLNSF